LIFHIIQPTDSIAKHIAISNDYFEKVERGTKSVKYLLIRFSHQPVIIKATTLAFHQTSTGGSFPNSCFSVMYCAPDLYIKCPFSKLPLFCNIPYFHARAYEGLL